MINCKKTLMKIFYAVTIICICSLLVLNPKAYAAEGAITGELLITFVDIEDKKNNHMNYSLYNLFNSEENLLIREPVLEFSAGTLTKDKKYLYLSRRNSDKVQTYVHLHQLELLPKKKKRPVLMKGTQQFLNVDYVKLNKGEKKIFMRVVQKNHRNAQLASYDLETNKSIVWKSGDTDTHVNYFDYSPQIDQVISIEHSLAVETSLVKEANARNEGTTKPYTYNINLYDSEGKLVKHVSQVKGHILDISFAPDGKSALYTSTSQFGPNSKFTIYSLDLNSGASTPIFSETDRFTKIKLAQYSPDSSKIYFLAIKSDSKPLSDDPRRKGIPRVLASYDLKTKMINEVISKERKKGTITYFTVIK